MIVAPKTLKRTNVNQFETFMLRNHKFGVFSFYSAFFFNYAMVFLTKTSTMQGRFDRFIHTATMSI